MANVQNIDESDRIFHDVNSLYNDRCDFCVIALTGYTASGCTTLASYMGNEKFYMDKSIRHVDSIELSFPNHFNNADIFFENEGRQVNASIALLNFKRKFSVCKEYIMNNYQPYTVIRYSWVLLLMALRQAADASVSTDDFIKNVQSLIIKDKYKPSVIPNKDDDYKTKTPNPAWEKIFDKFPNEQWENLYKNLKELKDEKESNWQLKLAKLFGVVGSSDGNVFLKFKDVLNDWMFKGDYYCASFFYHRLGYQLRKSGDVLQPYDNVYDKQDNFAHVYCVVKTINDIIKGIRHCEEGKKTPCRVVIDSVRNSLEARYMKERYAAFYLIAVHAPENAKSFFRKKVFDFLNLDYHDEHAQNHHINQMIEKAWGLGLNERSNKDFEKGKFAAPNIEKCVADAEIHIVNTSDIQQNSPSFQSMAEQWMKYASLILHPGLVTPSSEERCMVVAYTAKFNSGCISRQVGAVITNSAHSIRSIGWNDVPYGQTPCSLRSLYDYTSIVDNEGDMTPEHKYMYSSFEHGNLIPDKYKGETFCRKIMCKYVNLRHPEKIKDRLNGLPLTYCFKSLHNEFEGDKNQVHTRALHAEENAILQVARFGGIGLENGIIYVTASPCELCCKKLYQIGIRKIVYIDEYPGISRENIISIGFKRPDLKQFQGAFGSTYFKLYQPIMPYKEELALRMHGLLTPKDSHKVEEKYTKKEALRNLFKSMNLPESPKDFTKEQCDNFIEFMRSQILISGETNKEN